MSAVASWTEALLPPERRGEDGRRRGWLPLAAVIGSLLTCFCFFLCGVWLGLALNISPTAAAELSVQRGQSLSAEQGEFAATRLSAERGEFAATRLSTEREKSGGTCAWSPTELSGTLKKPRPPGPQSVYFCEPREGPPPASGVRPRLRDGQVAQFIEHFDRLFNETATLTTGGNAMFKCTMDCDGGAASAEHWGAAFVSVEGHRHHVGYDGHVSLMSQSKVVAYMLALQLLGSEKVEKYVSAEPSGRSFGDLSTMRDHRAFNPYISTGAEIIWALLDSASPGQWRDTVDLNRLAWERLTVGAGGTVRMRTPAGNVEDAAEAIQRLPTDPQELSISTSSSNLAAIYFMASQLAHIGGLPANASIFGTYQGFVMVNNLQLTPQMMAMAAATLANGGVHPLSGERVLSYRLVRFLLTTMLSAGLYDGSGRWAYTVGMPAKSGVAGGLMVVAPGVGGFATTSEPLDLEGNSARGLAFFSGLVHKFPLLHSFTPGAGIDPNLALTPLEGCRLVSKTIQQHPID